MSTFQKIIKYSAMTFAVFLIVSIISGICSGIGSVSFLFENDTDEITEEFESFSAANAIYANLYGAELAIKQGSTLTAESDSKYINCRQDGNKIIITEKKQDIFGHNNKSSKVTVYVPENMTFDEAEINIGAGKVTAETINAKKISLDVGAGKTVIDSLNVTDEANIDGGAGSIRIENGSIANLDADTGTGEFILRARLTGNSDIDHDIGEADISLAGNVIHLLDEPQRALNELKRVCKPNGKIIIPTYINKQKKNSIIAAKLLSKTGVDFKRQFDCEEYKSFFAGFGFEDVSYKVVEGHMPCAFAIITNNKSAQTRL